MTRGHRLLLGAGVALLLASGASAAMLLTQLHSATPIAARRVPIGGPFTLTTGAGAVVTDQTYRGKWMLVYFGYTFCPDACPTALNNISGAIEQLGPMAAKVQPLFITVDPRRDTPKVMADYVKAFDPSIIGLTGSPAEIAAVAKEYGVYVAPHQGEGADYVVDHSSLVYVMSPQGQFVTSLAGDAPSAQIADRLKRLAGQAS